MLARGARSSLRDLVLLTLVPVLDKLESAAIAPILVRRGGEEPVAILEATKAKDMFGDTLNRAAYGKERIILTRRGKPLAAIVPLEDLELLDAMENAADIEEVRAAREEAARGEVVPWESVKPEVDL
jgi:prevent-host-death family protein